MAADELHPDRETIVIESARNGRSRLASDIEDSSQF
jgi:hypothetical protein